MITQHFVLNRTTGLALNLTATRKWNDVSLRAGGSSLGPALSRADLVAGQTYRLRDGSSLSVRLELPFFMPTLRLEHDGIIIPGSESSADGLTARAGKWLLGVGVLNVLIGLLLFAPSKGAPNASELANPTLIVGAFFIAAGYFARKGSLPALVLGSGIFLWGVIAGLNASQPGVLVVQVIILTPMFRALLAHFQERRAGPPRGVQPLPIGPASDSRAVARPPLRFAETIAPGAISQLPRSPGTAAPRSPHGPPLLDADQVAPAVLSPPDEGAGREIGRPTSPFVSTTVREGSAPHMIGPYDVIEVLGRGGMATVYRARQSRIGRDVALKVISGDQAADPEFVERFRREAETTARLSHPHVLKVFDVGEDGARLYIAMELLPGGTLRDRVKASAVPISVMQTLKWAEQIGQAIQSAHTQGVVHRDIKLENVLLDQEDNAFLADFGLAHLTGVSGNLTQLGAQMGSPTYMAPEQWDGAEVTAAADLYAFGVLLFELLTGRPPFVAGTLPALMSQHLKAPVPSARALRSSLPAAIDRFFTVALSKAPASRFPDAATMLRAFQGAARGVATGIAEGVVERPAALPLLRSTPPSRPVTNRASSGAEESSRARGRQTLAIRVGVAFAVLATGGAAYFYAAKGAKRAPGRSATAPRQGESPTPEGDRPFSSAFSLAVLQEAPSSILSLDEPQAASRSGPSEALVAYSLPYDPAAPPLKGVVRRLPFCPDSAAFSPRTNTIVAVDQMINTLWIVRPDDGNVAAVALDLSPLSVSISGDGQKAVILHRASISVVDLTRRSGVRRFPLEGGPSVAAVAGEWAYLVPSFGEAFTTMNLRSGEVKRAGLDVRGGEVPPLVHPSGRRIYLLDSSSRVWRIEGNPRGNEAGPNAPPRQLEQSRVRGLWMSSDGSLAFTGGGDILSLSDDPSRDLQSAGNLPKMEGGIAAVAQFGRQLAVVTEVSRDDELDGRALVVFDFPGFRMRSRNMLPRFLGRNAGLEPRTRYLFVNRQGNRLYTLLKSSSSSGRRVGALYVGHIE